MAQRSLYVITKVYYRNTSCFAMDSPAKGPACSAKDSPAKGPTMWCRQITKHVTKNNTKMMPILTQPSKKLPIAFLISKQAVPYQTHGGTCCPRGSTPKIWSLADSSITCHDGINHLHHSNRCSNHNIDPHTVTSYLDGWKTTTLSQRHKPTQHHKGWKTCTTLMTAGLSITNHV
jgi:hypothetical protein